MSPGSLNIRMQSDQPIMGESEFHDLADASIARIESACTSLEDAVDGFDISSAMGVLTIKLGAKGTYVLNKQTPNRQIWWSSPISGPRRYQWNSTSRTWVNTRDGNVMLDVLRQELQKLTGVEIHFESGAPGS